MTSLVAVRCTNGVVIGADSAATFGDGQHVRTIEQTTEKKIEVVGDHVIVACTGYVGHSQRFRAVVNTLWSKGEFKNKKAIEIGKTLSSGGVNDFGQTMPAQHLQSFSFGAFVAFSASDGPCLCELAGAIGFQPEIKEPGDLWFSSAGSGQSITDPFLALIRSVFWRDDAPNLRGGIFTVLWALQHACEINPGGIKGPIKIAVLRSDKGKYVAEMLSDDQLLEHSNMVAAATDHLSQFRTTLLGEANTAVVPPAPPPG
jgi:hypothetical protein